MISTHAFGMFKKAETTLPFFFRAYPLNDYERKEFMFHSGDRSSSSSHGTYHSLQALLAKVLKLTIIKNARAPSFVS
jgi:hypothetical protein